MATVLETFGIIRADGALEQKLAVPPGRVRVRVESMEAPATEPAAESAEDLAKRFAQLAATWKAAWWKPVTPRDWPTNAPRDYKTTSYGPSLKR